MKKIIILSALACLLAGGVVSARIIEGEKSSGCVSRPSLGPATDFSLVNTHGGDVRLSSLKGKDVVLFFWASWCPNCLREISGMNKTYRELKDDGVELLAISVGEDKDKIKRFAQSRGLDFPIFLDEGQGVAGSYEIFGIPTYLILDKQGRIKFRGHYFPGDYEKYICEERIQNRG